MLDTTITEVGDRVGRVVAEIAARNGITKSIGIEDGLVDAGMTSIAMVDLMLAIEAEFDITIPQPDLKPQTFKSIATIEAMMSRVLARGR